MAEALRRSMPIDKVEETANFCQLMNDFFDCCNVRSVHEHERKQNKLLAPYEKCDDLHFVWLTETFLQYFFNWKEEINSKAEEFTKDQMDGCLFISKHSKDCKYLCTVSSNAPSFFLRVE